MKPKHPFCWGLLTLVLIGSLLTQSACQNKRRRGQIQKASATGNANQRPTPPVQRPVSTGALGKANSYRGVSTNRPVLALTYDDGPHATNTPRLLDILRAKNVRATFYVTGNNARKYPSILRRMIAEGHEIGNHTITHGRITSMSQSQARQEILGAHQAVRAATNVTPRSFRPPYGATNEQLKSWIKSEFGMPSILWSVDPEDWKKPGVGVVTSRLVNGAKPGGILLLHDIHSASIDATPGTIDQLKAKGFHFLTVSQLIALEQ